MRIAIVGAGAMGSIYAGLFSTAGAGHEVWAIDRWQEHVDAIRRNGLRVEGASGDRIARPNATTDPAEVGVADLVVIATKSTHVDEAARSALPLVGPGTVVLPIQNGLGSADRVASILGEDAVAIGVVSGFGASVVAPGHVHHHSFELVRLGERHGPVTPRIDRVAELWREAGFNVQTYDDVDQLVWEKLICNVAFSGVCTVLDATIGEVIDDPSAWAVATGCAAEAFAVARALGITLGFTDPVARAWEFGSPLAGARPSMALDLRAGRRSEVDVINGAIPPLAREVELAAPVNETVVRLVKAKEAALRVV
jgi:2-dehydropantoate 2-reductase